MDNEKAVDMTVPSGTSPPRVGDLYKTITTFGRQFLLRYGYYENIDEGGEPDVIYPDFSKEPVFTDKGEPFVTMMQDACEFFSGKAKRCEDTTCAECYYFCRGEEFFGICKHGMKQNSE